MLGFIFFFCLFIVSLNLNRGDLVGLFSVGRVIRILALFLVLIKFVI